MRQFLGWALICLIGALMISFSDLQSVFNLSSNVIWQDNAVKGYLLIAVSIFGWGAATVFGKNYLLLALTRKRSCPIALFLDS